MTLETVFDNEGYRVRSATDGLSALTEIRRETPDILLSDLNMPGMSGFELLSIVRRQFPEVRVIAMSGAFSGDAIPQGVAADAFLEKGQGSVERLLRLTRTLIEPAMQKSTPSTHKRRGALDDIEESYL